MHQRFNANGVGALQGPGPGRPRKFNRPSRAVTLTLPDDIIAVLETIDKDLSRAVVRAIHPLTKQAPRPLAELTNYGHGAVIIVSSNSVLRERTGVELIPLMDGRALIAFGDDLCPLELELRIRDGLADPSLEGLDRNLFEAVAAILTNARRDDRVALQQRNIIVLQRSK